ncbi:MAG: YibE/F family protein, partial [Lactobacillus iners]|nr:YibE/F family protein [Lactobacillus iners]
RTLGQEIMGPLINVLVLIFMAESLPMAILLLRDNNTLIYTCQFALSLGILQSLVSAIGIVVTVIFSALCCYVFIPKH